MATISWIIFKHHKKADGTYNPKIRVYHNKTTAYIPTQIYTPLVRFRKGMATGTVTDGMIENTLNKKVAEIRDLINRHTDTVELCENAKDVADFINRRNNARTELDFILFAKKHIDALPDNGTRNLRESLVNNLETFNRFQPLPVNKITTAFLRDFEHHLRRSRTVTLPNGEKRERKPSKESTVQNYLNGLKTILNIMKDTYNDYDRNDILIPGNPFRNFKLNNKIRYVKKAVDPETIRKIYHYQPKRQTTAIARDMFLLSFMLAGMNMADLYTFTHYRDGRIEYNRKKTRDKKKDGAFISLPVCPAAAKIIEKYRNNDGETVLNLSKRYKKPSSIQASIIHSLAKICKELDIERVTFYTARHSFATIARNECNVSMDDIALCLTHSPVIRITDTYIKPDFSRVDAVIDKVLSHVFNETTP